MPRWWVLALRFVVLGLLIVGAAWGSLWVYLGYEVHRARQLFEETSRVHVGDSEASVLPLVRRYGGFKWTPEPLSPKEDWLDKDEYEYQKHWVSDYKYELGFSPFGTTDRQTSRLTQAMRAIKTHLPAHLRPVLGMRDWGVAAELSIRNGRVQSVSAMTLFTGRSGWLGHEWELAEQMPHYGMPARAYTVGEAILTMEDGGGTMIQNFLTPSASEEEIETARQFNARCLTSIHGCNGLCDVAPRALEHLKRQPDAAWNIIPPKCQ